MIDTHSHIYLPEFDSDLDLVINNARTTGVEQILLPNVDETTIEPMLKVEHRYPDLCHAMMGLHPTSVKADYQAQMSLIEHHLGLRKYIGIGEVGIDLYWDKTYRTQQMEVFSQHLQWAKEMDLPVVIHCRDAFPEVFEVVESHLDEKLRGIFHSFTGGINEVETIMGYGSFLLGINGVVTFKNTTLREVLTHASLDHVVLETDAPYLAPVPYRGKRNEPAYLSRIATQLAGVFHVSEEEVKQRTTANAKNMFDL